MASGSGSAAVTTPGAHMTTIPSGADTFYAVRPISDGVFVSDTRRIGMGGYSVGNSPRRLIAGLRTVPDGWVPHVLHAYFLSPGREGVPVTLSVSSLRDGGRSCHRRIGITQDDKTVAEVTVIFGAAEEAPPHPCVEPPPFGPSDSLEKRSIFHTKWNYSDLDLRVPQDSDGNSRKYHRVGSFGDPPPR